MVTLPTPESRLITGDSDVTAIPDITSAASDRGFDTVIGSTMVIEGTVSTENSARIDGIVHGDVVANNKILTNYTSRVAGDIRAATVEIGGLVVGNVKALSVHLNSSANIKGNITCAEIQIDAGAVIKGYIEAQKGFKLNATK